jgi:hypothetical protein
LRFALRLLVLTGVFGALPLQSQGAAGGRSEVFAGSVFESYLRYLQSLGKSGSEPWSIRGFSPREVDDRSPKTSDHPWADRYQFRSDSKRARFDYVRPTVKGILNTEFPFGGNDGPVWAGKGLTTVVQAGVTAEVGPLSVRIAPIAFRAANSEFPLYENGESGNLAFGHGQFARLIDLPQRFGDRAYSRIDPGESTIRLDAFGVALGASTASQWWGPTETFPYVLGNNAGGFPHAFVGTSKPANLGIVRFHTRLVYGMIVQSEFSPVTGSKYYQSPTESGRDRFMAGAVAVLQVNRVPGFEIGGARFFHAPLSKDGISGNRFGLPFQNLYRKNLPVIEGRENQLGSLFVRWAPIGSGFDVYGEYGREDFSADTRDYLLQPEHAAMTNVGFRKAWGSASTINAVKAEAFSYEASAGSRTRDEGLAFLHGVLLQGHTSRGQLLSAPVGPGSGNAQTAGFDRFTRSGRLSVTFSRIVAHEDRSYLPPNPVIDPAVDVMNSLGAEVTRFVGPLDVTAGLILTRELNRYLGSEDASNANFSLSLRYGF